MSSVRALKCFMDEYDSERLGERICLENGFEQDKIDMILKVINPGTAYKHKLDPDKYNYVTDVDGGEYILSADYNSYIKDYGLYPAFFMDLLPSLYEVIFDIFGQTGKVYYLYDMNGEECVFLNNNALEYFKNISKEEIYNILKKAIGSSERDRKEP